jgi:acetyltransferase
MTIRNLDAAFRPQSVALIGASSKANTIGLVLTRNLLEGRFPGQVSLVNPRHSEILGRPCVPSVSETPFTPDLAIVATPPKAVPEIIAALGAKGTRAAVVITAGVKDGLANAMLAAAKPYVLRIVGPNCLGIQLPGLGLNASFAKHLPAAGTVALASQSGAIVAAMLDWGASKGIGFSHVVSIGDMADVDLGDMLDYLAGDAESRAVFLYIEQVTDAGKFISAARRCARAKPVIAIKSGRHASAAKAAASHTGALAGTDTVYDAALKRAGILRVLDIDDLFSAAEALSVIGTVKGGRLGIVTNGGGAGVLAADALADMNGELAELSQQTLAVLDAALPATWSKGNPVDIIGDAGPERYRTAVSALLGDTNVDAILAINCPTALASSVETAAATANAVADAKTRTLRPTPVLASWFARTENEETAPIFAAQGIPNFDTPRAAVEGLMQIVRYGRAQMQLMQTPPALPDGLAFDVAAVDRHIANALASGRTMMGETEAKAVLQAYGIPTTETQVAATPEEAASKAEALLREHASVAVKVLSPDITHKTDLGGVRLDLTSADEVAQAAAQIISKIKAARPGARLDGVTVQPMVKRPDAFELLLGIASDPTFGPVLVFGAGGTEVEAIADTAMALPPLDLKLARDLIEETRIAKLLKGYRGKPSVDLEELALCLVKLGSLATHHPEFRELDINPLLIDAKGMVALDARVRVESVTVKPATPPAIRPYPDAWTAVARLSSGDEVSLRPIRPDDEHLYGEFLANVTPEDRRLRMLTPTREFSHAAIARWTQIDYRREMAFIALSAEPNPRMLGVARLHADPDYERAEYAILVRSDVKGRGLGWVLMQHLIAYARSEGLSCLKGTVLRENTVMLSMCRELGFQVRTDPDDQSLCFVRLSMALPS